MEQQGNLLCDSSHISLQEILTLVDATLSKLRKEKRFVWEQDLDTAGYQNLDPPLEDSSHQEDEYWAINNI